MNKKCCDEFAPLSPRKKKLGFETVVKMKLCRNSVANETETRILLKSSFEKSFQPSAAFIQSLIHSFIRDVKKSFVWNLVLSTQYTCSYFILSAHAVFEPIITITTTTTTTIRGKRSRKKQINETNLLLIQFYSSSIRCAAP